MHIIRNFSVIITVLVCAVSASHADVVARPAQNPQTLDNSLDNSHHAYFEFVSRKSTFLSQLNQNLNDQAVLKIFHDAYSENATSNLSQLVSGLRRPAHSYYSLQWSPSSAVIRVAVEDFPELAERWNVTALPTFLVIDQGGGVISRHEGLMNREAFIDFLAPPVVVAVVAQSMSPQQPAPRSGVSSTLAAQGRPGPYGGATMEMMHPPAGNVAVGVGLPDYSSLAIIPWTTNTAVEPRISPDQMISEPSSASRPEPHESMQSSWTGSSGTDTSFRGRFTISGRKEFLYTRKISSPTLWRIRLKTDPSDVDVDVEVLDDESNRVAAGESPLGNEEILLAVGEGTYTMRIFTVQRTNDPANFSVMEEYNPLPSDRVVPATSGKTLTLDDPEDDVVLQGKEQWFLFTADRPGRYGFTVNPGRDGSAIEASVINSSGEIVGANRIIRAHITPGDEPDFMVEVRPQEKVALRLTLKDARGHSTPVSVTVARNTEIDVAAVKLMLEPGQKISGTVGGSAGIEHIYRVKVPTEGTWSIALKSPREDSDIDMEILKSDAELVERSEGPSSSEILEADIGPRDDRYIRVYAYRATEPIEFTLELKATGAVRHDRGQTDEPTRRQRTNPSENQTLIKPPADATAIGVNVIQRDALGLGEAHWYRIESDQTGRYGLFLDGSPSESDIDMAVASSDGQQLAISQSDEAREALLLDLIAGEPVFVRVFAYQNSSASTYKIWFERVGR